MADGTHCVSLAGAGHPERQHDDAAVDEASLAESLDLLPEPHRGSVVLEGVPGPARRQLRRSSQTVHPSDPSVFCSSTSTRVTRASVCPASLNLPRVLHCRGEQIELPAQVPDTFCHHV